MSHLHDLQPHVAWMYPGYVVIQVGGAGGWSIRPEGGIGDASGTLPSARNGQSTRRAGRAALAPTSPAHP